MEEILNSYYENDAKKLRKLVNRVFYEKFGGIANKDMDEFYSVANDVFTDIVKKERYNPSKGDFQGFLYKSLHLAFIDEFKYQTRDKRCVKNEVEKENEQGKIEKIKVPIKNISLDSPIGEDENFTIGDTIQSDFDIDSFLCIGNEYGYSEKVEEYINNLPSIPRKIAEMIISGYSSNEIKDKLKLSNNKYYKNYEILTHFKNIQILKCNNSKEDDLQMMTTTQTMENCKTDKISVASIIKKIDKHTIRFDHPLQRESERWSPAMKGNLISDILQGNRLHPLIFAEQIINGVAIIWDLDGKQRCTNAYSYANNGYKISKNIRRWNIRYQTTEKDENGNDILDENGFPIAKNEEFDIRNKRFSDLPEELQEKFLDYTFNYDQYLNCSEEDIGYHIERYNDGKPMNTMEKGITKIGTEYAEMVKSISNMPFFRDMGGYKVSEFKNGTINRVVIESVMAANFLDDWRKEQEKQCKYLKENAKVSTFDNFEDMVERLEKIVTDDVVDMFDSKNSFLYFGLFARFIKTGLDDKKFVEFLAEFSQSLHSKIVNGITYDELCIDKKTGKSRATKDKYIVVQKMKLLETLMYEFLHIENENKSETNNENNKEEIKNDNVEEVNNEEVANLQVLNFVKENVNSDVIQDDIGFHDDNLKAWTVGIPEKSKLNDDKNRPSMTAIAAYAFENDELFDDETMIEWFADYENRNKMYLPNQKENYLHMKADLDKYIMKGVA